MESEKKLVPTILFAIFGGGLGLHRFYVGKIGTGITMVLLSLTMIGMIITVPWALIDLIMIATGNFKDKEGKVIKN
jgi:TM2 domain-containing membrane protein YozV